MWFAITDVEDPEQPQHECGAFRDLLQQDDRYQACCAMCQSVRLIGLR